jgi:hypothetical protein
MLVSWVGLFHQFSFQFLWGWKGTWKRVSGFVAFAVKSVSVKLYVPMPICSLGCKSFGYSTGNARSIVSQLIIHILVVFVIPSYILLELVQLFICCNGYISSIPITYVHLFFLYFWLVIHVCMWSKAHRFHNDFKTQFCVGIVYLSVQSSIYIYFPFSVILYKGVLDC